METITCENCADFTLCFYDDRETLWKCKACFQDQIDDAVNFILEWLGDLGSDPLPWRNERWWMFRAETFKRYRVRPGLLPKEVSL